MLKKLLLTGVAAAIISVFSLSAQVNEIRLVTSGDGKTEMEAVNNALKSAIEQAYGAFVSANTDILNDNLVKDEIVTVSSGNIHSYKILGRAELPNGFKTVSVESVVSVSNLVQFAQSKGAACEFAGNVFGANLKLIELNKANAEKALEHLYVVLENIASIMYDYELSVGQPKANGRIILTVTAKANENYKSFTDVIYNTLTSLSADNTDQLDELNIHYNSALIKKHRFTSLFTHGVYYDEREINHGKTAHYAQQYRLFYHDYYGIEGSYSNLDRVIDILPNLDKNIDKIRNIQIGAMSSFRVVDSKEHDYDFTFPSARPLGSEILDAFVEPNYYKFGLCAVDMIRDIKFRNSSKVSRLLSIPDQNPGDVCMYYEKEFKIPVEELTSISGFKVEKRIKDNTSESAPIKAKVDSTMAKVKNGLKGLLRKK